jgi:hypothetical protein
VKISSSLDSMRSRYLPIRLRDNRSARQLHKIQMGSPHWVGPLSEAPRRRLALIPGARRSGFAHGRRSGGGENESGHG